MENVLLIAISQYFIFYVFNYTPLGNIFSEPLKKQYNLLKVQESWLQNLLYPLFCALCFSFHFTTLLFILSYFISTIHITLWNFTVGPIVALILDNIIKFLAKNG